MHLANIQTPLTWLLILPVVALLGIVLLVSLRKFSFVKMAFAVMFSLCIAGVIVVVVAGNPEARMKVFRPGSMIAMTSHSYEAPVVPLVPSNAEIQAHIDEAMSRVRIDQERFENEMQVRIDTMEGTMATSYVYDSKSQRRHHPQRGLPGRLGTSLVIGFVMFAFLYVCYLFLDAGTRGQFTWSLRIASLLAFVFMMVAIQVLHQRGSL